MKEQFSHLSPCWNLGEDGRTPTPTDDYLAWAQWMIKIELRRVALDVDDVNEVAVSTVFLGTLGSLFVGKPMFYQTMIFGGPHAGYEKRYSTWEEAEEGHNKACEHAGVQCKEDK